MDLDERFASLDRSRTPDQWADIATRTPSRRPPRSTRKVVRYAGVALVTIILAAGIIVPLKALWPLGNHGSAPNAAGQPPSSQMYLGLWPERTLAEAQQVQVAVDAGDQTESWRTDPEEVAKRFVIDVMGWREDMGDAPGLFVQNLGEDSPCCTFRVARTPHSWPYPGPPWWETASEEITVRQFISPGAEGIWSVTGVRADQLTVPYEPGAEVGTDAQLQGRIDSREDHIQLGGEGGSACSQGEVVTIKGPDAAMPDYQPWTSQVTFFRSPECGKTGDGYVALVVGGSDPPVDPFGPVNPGLQKRYIPALTMVPVRFIPMASESPSPTSATPCPSPVTVPSLQGMSVVETLAVLNSTGLVAGHIQSGAQPTSGAVVIDQDPAPGTQTCQGDAVSFLVSPALERDFATVSRALRQDLIWVAPYSSSYGTPVLTESEAIAKVTDPSRAKDATAILAVASGQNSPWPEGRRVVWLVMNPPGWSFTSCLASITTPPPPCPKQYGYGVDIVDAQTGRIIAGTNVPGFAVRAPGNPAPSPSPAVPDDTHLSAYLVQSGLLDRVMTMAAANEVPQPESIQAVVTSPNEVTALLNDEPAGHGPPSDPVVFVQVTGSFVCHTCKQLSDTPITGSAMYVEAKLGTGGITGFGILKQPLDLTELGTPVDIPVPG